VADLLNLPPQDGAGCYGALISILFGWHDSSGAAQFWLPQLNDRHARRERWSRNEWPGCPQPIRVESGFRLSSTPLQGFPSFSHSDPKESRRNLLLVFLFVAKCSTPWSAFFPVAVPFVPKNKKPTCQITFWRWVRGYSIRVGLLDLQPPYARRHTHAVCTGTTDSCGLLSVKNHTSVCRRELFRCQVLFDIAISSQLLILSRVVYRRSQ
jgi:hypothetical protein